LGILSGQKVGKFAGLIRFQIFLHPFRHHDACALRELVRPAALALPARRVFRPLVFLRKGVSSYY
jgi:hypothetical protein